MACMLHLAFATGTEPGKWFQRFQRDTPHGLDAVAVDDPFAALYDGSGPDGLGGSGPDGADHKADYETDHEAGVGEGGVSEVTADLALMRLPDKRVDEAAIGRQFHVVKLYTEQCGIAVPKDSVYAEVGEAVAAADIEGEIINFVAEHNGPIDVDELREALQVVAANVGVVIGPLPLLKLLSKKQISVVPYVGGEVVDRDGGVFTAPETEIALVWKVADDGDAIQDFVGIAKGRKSGSTRHRAVKDTRGNAGGKTGGAKASAGKTGRGARGKGAGVHGKGNGARAKAGGGPRKKKRRR